MKISHLSRNVLTTLLLGSTFVVVKADPMQTCAEQASCMEFTVTKIEDSCQDDDECSYSICQSFQLGGACIKSASDTISHVCAKPDLTCPLQEGFESSAELGGIANGETYCQVVPVGGVAEFLVKDGNAKDGCGSDSIFMLGGTQAECETFGEESCTGKGNVGKECVWRVPAPTDCFGMGGGIGGDPHIKLWNGTRYSFHGECDLMMLHADDIGSVDDYDKHHGDADYKPTSFDLHIRSTIIDFYSYIETAALRIGDTTLEVTSGHFYVNGEEQSDNDLPLLLAEHYTLQAPEQIGNAKVYRLDLDEKDSILFRTYKQFVSVDISASRDFFGTSQGLLGDFYTGDMIGRTGQLVEHVLDFGLEWQVTEEEPKLFRDSDRAPQLPHAQCVMPAATSRHLLEKAQANAKLVQQAEEACAHKSKNDFSFCVHDVLATGDVGMAHAW